MWYQRTLESLLNSPSSAMKLFKIWLILGPRQVGKSSLLLKCKEANRRYINLDDLATRELANRDPILFSKDLIPPILIDEIQYAPALLSPLKIIADSATESGIIWLTGSQSFEVMRGVHESLAGRVGILNLYGFSDEEKLLKLQTPQQFFSALLRTTFPALVNVDDHDAQVAYVSNYLQTYIERDIRELLGIQKRREFETFIKIAALRTGSLVNYDEMARDSGISSATAKEWLSLLEDSFLIKLVHPYFSNRTKRLIKNPKLYFLDVGLAAHLAGWSNSEMLRLGPMSGAIFETYIFGEILRAFKHRARDCQIYFWRTKDGNEIDFLVETRSKIFPIEVKLGSPDRRDLCNLTKIRDPNWQDGLVVSLAAAETSQQMAEYWRMIQHQELVKHLVA